MPNTKHIDIPVPCSQQWGQMAPNREGRFCDHCHKTVIDFTGLTNQQIIDVISGSSKICGRLENKQLSAINDMLNRETVTMPRNIWKRIAIAAAVIWSIPFLKTEAQSKLATVQQPVMKDDSKPVNTSSDTITYRTITGKLIIAQSKLPLIGGVIRTTNAGITHINTVSNSTGDFKIRIPVTTKNLTVSYIGYNNKTVQLNEKSDYLIVVDEINDMFLGEVVAPSLLKKPADKKK